MNDKSQQVSLDVKAKAAFQRAAQKVIERARIAGTNIVIWENDKIKELSPDAAKQMVSSHESNESGNGSEGS